MEGWERIFTIIKEQGLNKNSFSRRIGLKNNVTITMILNKHRKPQMETLEKIADAFPLYSRAWVLYGEEPKMSVDAQNGGVVPLKVLNSVDDKENINNLLETLKRLIDQNILLMETNERNSKTIKNLVDILVSNGVKINKQSI